MELAVTTDTELLDVGLRGSRRYVQGSQILGRTAEWLRSLGHGDATLTAAKFTSITEKMVVARLGRYAADSDGLIGAAHYRSCGVTLHVSFFEEGGIAPQLEDEPSRITGLHDEGGLIGTAIFHTDGSHSGYLAAVIEMVKALHGSLGHRVSDIWFTGLANAEIPTASGCELNGSLSATPLLTRNHAGRRQTLNRIATQCQSGGVKIAPFNLSFSCLIEED